MQFPYMVNVQLHKVGSGNASGRQNKMSHFCKLIGNNIDCIETIQLRKLPYKGRLNPLPRPIWSQVDSIANSSGRPTLSCQKYLDVQ